MPFQDLKPSNIAVNEDCELKVRFFISTMIRLNVMCILLLYVIRRFAKDLLRMSIEGEYPVPSER